MLCPGRILVLNTGLIGRDHERQAVDRASDCRIVPRHWSWPSK